MATTFSVGELSCSMCVGEKAYPPPGIMVSSVWRTSSTVSRTVPLATGPAVEMQP